LPGGNPNHPAQPMVHHKNKARRNRRPALPIPRLIVPRLLAWFAASARDLPWRRTRDPYGIWVSEIMLQQTQVKTVIPYWERWMRELPTIQSLAQAAPERIHKLWEGLGYYTRVRNLQKAAQQLVSHHGGRFPANFDAILALPGVGRYTAGAIASIAFNQPAPILDGNVIRVLTRLHGIGEDPLEKKTNARLWQLAEALVAGAKDAKAATGGKSSPPPADDTSCSFLNQSLMELGALICTPRSPDCAACPVATLCFARRTNRVEEFPRPKQRAAATARRFVALLLERDGRFLVRQRPAGEVNGHLWEFPSIEVTGDHRSPPPLPAGLRMLEAKPLCVVKHSITRYRMTTEAWRAAVEGTSHAGSILHGEWRTSAQLHKLAFTSAHRRIVSRLEKSMGAA
jgi:A/G-specific adenine glycosylase